MKTGITLRDRARRDAAFERNDRVARGLSADEADLALAALACACGLGRHLPLGIGGRWRLARVVKSWKQGRDVGDVVAEAKRGGAEAVVRSNPIKVALLTDSVIDTVGTEYWRWRKSSEYDGFATKGKRTSGQGGIW